MTEGNIGFYVEPIGQVFSEFSEPEELFFACEDGLQTKTISGIILDEKYREGLKGLEQFSHLFVMYILHKAEKVELLAHPGPPVIPGLPLVGVFASRSQFRPNHIALRLVKLNKIEEGTIYVEGLDAINGSKVIDIKPYVKGFDRPETFKTAYWYDWLEKMDGHPDSRFGGHGFHSPEIPE